MAHTHNQLTSVLRSKNTFNWSVCQKKCIQRRARAREINKLDNTNFGVKVYFGGGSASAASNPRSAGRCDHCANLTPTGKVIVDFSLSLKHFNS